MSSRHRREAGFTLVELMVAIFVLLVGVLGSVALVDGANRTSAGTRAREGATNLARDVIETMHNIGIKQAVATGANLPALLQSSGIGGTVSGSNLSVNRRNFTYTVQTTACAVDDSADGQGTQDASFRWCGPSSGTTDSNPLDYARVNVVVSWTDRGGTHNVQQASVLNNQSDGPVIVGPTLTAPSNLGPTPVITDQAVNSLSFGATSDQAASWAEWYLNGSDKGAVSKTNGTDWAWTWNIGTATGPSPCSTTGGGVLDGTYLIGVQAFDASGMSGGTKALTVTLNRCAPITPTGLLAVRTILFGDVELTWDANPEPDVVGYHVYRNGVLVPSGGCSGLVKTSQCTETTDPGGSLTYTVVAVDKDQNGNLRESAQSVSSSPATTNTQPKAPTGIVTNSLISTLKFTTPTSPQDPDSGDSIKYFNIYRDGQTANDRYDTVSNTGVSAGTTLAWDDSAPGNGSHTYWVTAVDSHGAESAWNGSVFR